MTDYRKLLIKYIAHVSTCEGIDYIGRGYDIKLTDNEIKELEDLAKIAARYFYRS